MNILNNIKIIYGGSVNSSNIKNIMNIYSINGVLLGKSSLDIHEIEKMNKEIYLL